jgi:hypothetical protein
MQRRPWATAAVLTAAAVALPGVAHAQFGATGTGPAQLGATRIRNASGLTSACVSNAGPDDVKLTWSASPDSAFVSYVVDRTATGGGVTASIPAAGSATTVNDVNTFTNASGYTYTYTIRAVVGTAPWTTAASASTTRTFTKSGKCS